MMALRIPFHDVSLISLAHVVSKTRFLMKQAPQMSLNVTTN